MHHQVAAKFKRQQIEKGPAVSSGCDDCFLPALFFVPHRFSFLNA
jgi:hypothetical protein